MPRQQRWTPSQYLGGFGATVEWWLEQNWQSPDPDAPLDRRRLLELFDAALLESVPGSHGLHFLPLGGPSQTVGFSAGAFVGLTLAHTRTDMSRAILEGTAFEVRWALENLRAADMPVDELWIAGGATKSPVWPQILADVSGVPIVLADYPSWAALGAAVLAGWGVGAFATLAEGVERLRPPVRRLEPDRLSGTHLSCCFRPLSTTRTASCVRPGRVIPTATRRRQSAFAYLPGADDLLSKWISRPYQYLIPISNHDHAPHQPHLPTRRPRSDLRHRTWHDIRTRHRHRTHGANAAPDSSPVVLMPSWPATAQPLALPGCSLESG